MEYTVYACTWIQFISDIRDVKDILVRIQHKQFDFSTELENLKTNQTGETRLTKVTIVMISHCQKVETIYYYEKHKSLGKFTLLRKIYITTKNIITSLQKRKPSFFNHLSSVR